MENKVIQTFKYAWSSRKVWWFTASSRTKARFARTLLGGFWLGFSNLLSIAALSAVYGVVFKVQDFGSYVVYLGVGLVCWNSIASSFLSAPSLFEANATQLLNTNTDHVFYTLEEWAFQIQTFFQSFFLVLIGLSFYQFDLFFNLVTIGIFPLLNLIIFIYWFPIFISIAGIRYKDFYQLIPIIVQLVFLLSPFLYEKKSLGSISWTADYNPLYQVVNSVRETIITGELSFKKLIIIFIMNIIGLCYSIRILNKAKKILPFLI